MNREEGTGAVAASLEYTSTPTAESSYVDGTINLGQAKRTTGKAVGATIPGHGFPSNEPSLGRLS
jgi:hypothetical protein